jgi:CTP:molybdopterin cytidylyltransferase MocA
LYETVPGTPIVVNDRVLMALRSLADGDSLASLCVRHGNEVQHIEFDSAAVIHTLTTYADWEDMQEMFDL